MVDVFFRSVMAGPSCQDPVVQADLKLWPFKVRAVLLRAWTCLD